MAPPRKYAYPLDDALVAAFAEHGSYTRTAAALGIPRGALQQHVQRHPDLLHRVREARPKRSASEYRTYDHSYPADDVLVALMEEHQSFGEVAKAVGVGRGSLRDYLSRRPELDARMRQHQRAPLTEDERLENNRRAGRDYQRRFRAQNPQQARRVRREQMRTYGPDYRHKWNHYNRLRRKGLAPPTPEADEYAGILRSDPCSYCGATCEHIDHIHPIVLGGDGDYMNLTAACADCNRRKQGRSALVFLLEGAAYGVQTSPAPT